MSTLALTRNGNLFPSVFEDFFKPWNEWFDNGQQWPLAFNSPAVNIEQHDKSYELSLAAPGLNKNDFKIDVQGNILTISSEKETKKEEKEKKFTRKEYSYASFSRSFTLPEEINVDKIDASYKDGVLNVSLPRKADAKQIAAKHVAVK